MCYQSGTYLISYEVLRSAKELSANYLDYARMIFEALFDMEIAIYCKCEGTNSGDGPDCFLRATIPREAINVFLGKFFYYYIIGHVLIHHSRFVNRTYHRCG